MQIYNLIVNQEQIKIRLSWKECRQFMRMLSMWVKEQIVENDSEKNNGG